MAEARGGVAAILGADVDSVALTHATTDGMNLADVGGSIGSAAIAP